MQISARIYRKSWYNGVIREGFDSAKYGKSTPLSPDKKERLKLDPMLKMLFRLSDKLTLHMISYFFGDDYAGEDVSIVYNDQESISEDFERRIGDLFMTIQNEKHKQHYHIEFQTHNDSAMVIRMFRYGFDDAVKRAIVNDPEQSRIIDLPKQLVIFLEENSSIHNMLTFTLCTPDGNEMPYNVPVIKYWEYSIEQLKQEKMYGLLPLQVFKFRRKIEAIKNSGASEQEKSMLITEQFALLKDTIQELLQTLGELRDQNEFLSDALGKMLDVIGNINTYLYKRYEEYAKIEEEADLMMKTYYSDLFTDGIEKGIEQGIRIKSIQIAKSLLNEGMSIEMISEITGLNYEEIAQLNKADREK